ncbi:MAG: hypothetical protein AAGA54_03980 [Myxococcota bacterium]
MTNTVGTSGVSREELARHFDGELTGAEAHELAAQIDADPELQAELAQLGIIQGLVSETLMAKAEAVPQARFEQMWDEIDRTLDREAKASTASGAQPASFWSRMMEALRPVRWPLAGAAAAAAVALVVFSGGDDVGPDGANKADAVASAPQPDATAPTQDGATPKPAPTKAPKAAPPAGDMMAQAPDPEPADDMPKPKKVEAEIHGVEFSGHTGRISKTGTVTVLYLEEEAEPKDSERSL